MHVPDTISQDKVQMRTDEQFVAVPDVPVPVMQKESAHVPNTIPQDKGQLRTDEQFVPLFEGDLVRLHGLRMRPLWNDAEAVVCSYQSSKQRWAVQLLDSGEHALIKRANMELVERWNDQLEQMSAEWWGEPS